MQLLTRLLQQLWSVFFHASPRTGQSLCRPARQLAREGLHRPTSTELLLHEGDCPPVAVPASRSLCDFPRSLRSRRPGRAGGKQSDPADITFCERMYHLS